MSPARYEHQCFAKCLREEECVGADCFCEGALKGYDDPDTRALCISEAKCLEICAGKPECVPRAGGRRQGGWASRLCR